MPAKFFLPAAEPLPFRDHFHQFRVESFGVVVLGQVVVQRFALRNETDPNLDHFVHN